jgi:hypothetical protein
MLMPWVEHLVSSGFLNSHMEKLWVEDFGASHISTGRTKKKCGKSLQIANEVKNLETTDGLGHLYGVCRQILPQAA